MSEDVLMMIAMVTGAVLIVGHLARTRRAHLLQQTIREALRTDSKVIPALLDKVDDQEPRSGGGDDRTGLVLIAIAAALLCYAAMSDPREARDIAAIALFPLFVGAVLLARFVFLAWRSGR